MSPTPENKKVDPRHSEPIPPWLLEALLQDQTQSVEVPLGEAWRTVFRVFHVPGSGCRG